MFEDSGSYRARIERFEVEVKQGRYGQLLLSTVVFADDYIPPSVRATVAEEASLIRSPLLQSSLKVDERARQVVLSAIPFENEADRAEVMAEFLAIAAEWEARLHERGERDLIRVKV